MLLLALLLSAAAALPVSPAGTVPQSAGDPAALVSQARASSEQGEYAKAIALLEGRPAAWEAAGRLRDALDASGVLTLAYWNAGRVDDARRSAVKARDLANLLGLNDEAVHTAAQIEVVDLYLKAKALRDEANDPAASITVFDQAVALARKIKSPDLEAKCLRQQSINHYRLESWEAYRDLNRQALALFLRLKNRRDEGVCRNNLGVYYLKVDDYTEALAQSEAALALAREFGNAASITDSLTNLSLAYTELGEFEKAAKALDEVLAIDGPAGDPVRLGIDLNNLGIVHRRKGLLGDDRRDFQSAARRFEEALAKLDPTDQTGYKAQVSNNIGSAYSQLGEYDKALAAFERGLELAEKADGYEIKSIILNNIGIVYARLGEYERSTGFYQKAVDLALEHGGKQHLWEIYLELGNARRGLGRDEEAAEDYRASISIIEDIRATISTEELRATYFGSDKRLDAYHNLIDLLAGGDTPPPERVEAAFETMEKAKARSFLDTLEVRAVMNQRPGADAAAQNRERELLSGLSGAYRKLLRPDEAGGRKAPVRAEIEGIEDELERLRREMRRADPALARLKYPSTATLAEAQSALPDRRTKAFAFILGKEKSYAFALDKAGLEAYPLPRREILRTEVEDYLRKLSDTASTDFASGAALFEMLLKPGLDEDTEKIIIIPDGILYYLPFEALPQNRPAKGAPPAAKPRWLVEDYEVSYAPSLSSYREIRERSGRIHGRTLPALLAVGAPAYPTPESLLEAERLVQGLYPDLGAIDLGLSATGRELDLIAALFSPKRRTVLAGAAATEEGFKARSSERARIIHLAAHGLVDDRKPMRSAVVLLPGPSPESDGLLQTREVMDFELATDLVVLSACRTGLGRLLRGEGIEGLNRAFFTAGASTVLMTLWSVSDEAGAPLMERFYRRLRASSSAASALRAAKADMIASPALSHPYYWAGYIAAGDADRVLFPDNRVFWVFLILGTAALVLLGRLFFARRRA